MCNISRHYETRHVKNKAQECELVGEMRKEKVIKLKKVASTTVTICNIQTERPGV